MSEFRGFQFDLPSYTVITPQTGETFNVRSLTVLEVNKLKTSLVTPSKAHALVNDMLWTCLQNKPDHMKNSEGFKKAVSTLDREALLYGLYHVTFGDDREFHVVCTSCGNEQLIQIQLSRVFKMNAYPGSEGVKASYKVARAVDEADPDPEIEEAIAAEKQATSESAVTIGEDVAPEGMPIELAALEGLQPHEDGDDNDGIILTELAEESSNVKMGPGEPVKVEVGKSKSILDKQIRIDLPISKIVAIIRQPSIYDEEQLLTELAFASKKQGDLVNETMIIERFEQFEESDPHKPSVVVSRRDDILWGYQSLPPRDKIKIFDKYTEEFGKYCIELTSNFECNKCGFDNDLDVNIAVQFFRMVGIS